MGVCSSRRPRDSAAVTLTPQTLPEVVQWRRDVHKTRRRVPACDRSHSSLCMNRNHNPELSRSISGHHVAGLSGPQPQHSSA